MTVRSILDRFRPAGVPAGVAASGVPTDRQESAAIELAPVFAALAATMQECAELRADAAAEAGRLQQEASDQAAVLVRRAHDEVAVAQRREALARTYASGLAAVTRVEGDSVAEAERVRSSARERQAHLVAGVVARVRAELAAGQGEQQ